MWPKAERGSRSLDIRDTPTDRFDRRRSVELARSTRRYDEGWGAAERADTRLKCSDGIIHHVHSQVLSLWSTVLRNMIVLIPGPQLLESTHGLAYVLNVDEGSSVWGAVLDVMYPVLRTAHPSGHPADPVLQRTHEWVLLEQCLLLADKYDMPVVTQTLLQQTLFSSGAAAYTLDPSQPSYALHWLALADKLQLPQLAQSALTFVQASLAQLPAQPGAMDALLSYAHEHLSKQQVMQLLQASMQHAASNHQQEQQQLTQLQQQEPVQMMLVVPSSPSPSPSWPQQHQPPFNSHTNMSQGGMAPPGGPWSSAANQAFMAAAAAAASAAAAAAFNTCSSRGHAAGGGSGSASTAPGLESVQECSSSSDDDSRAEEQQQRVDMCRASSLFAPAAAAAAAGGPVQQQQQQQQQEACARLGSGWGNTPGAGQARNVCAALPVTQQQQQQQQQQQCTSMLPMNPPSFGFGVNAGNTSIEDWMKQSFPMQADSMCG